jgi:hypothetical protein
MADDRSIPDLLWDYTVYAPIGLAVSLAEELPKLSEKGRERIGGQVQIARVIGRFSVGEAQRRVERMFAARSRPPATGATAAPRDEKPAAQAAAARPRSRTASDPSGVWMGSHESDNGSRAGRASTITRNRRAAGSSGGEPVPARRGPAASAPAPARTANRAVPARAGAIRASNRAAAGEVPAAASLAIPGYDTLAASQVVQRLSSLRPGELDAIRRYELATRGRRTILHRIAQLAADR